MSQIKQLKSWRDDVETVREIKIAVIKLIADAKIREIKLQIANKKIAELNAILDIIELGETGKLKA